MNKYVCLGLLSVVTLFEAQMASFAQAPDLHPSPDLTQQAPVLQPMSATADSGLRGPIGQTAPTSSPAPFSNAASSSYTVPLSGSNPLDTQPTINAPAPSVSPTYTDSQPFSSKKYKKHDTSPFGAVLGVQDRAAKSSLGLTDRAAKTGVGFSGKAAKEVFKAIF